MQEGFQQFGYVGEKIPILVKNCENYAGYGNTWYRQEGLQIHVHIGVEGLAANTRADIANIPADVSPENAIACIGIGSGLSDIVTVHIGSSGKISLASESKYAMVDIYYLKW